MRRGVYAIPPAIPAKRITITDKAISKSDKQIKIIEITIPPIERFFTYLTIPIMLKMITVR
jgi:hypothetical protein